MAKNRFIITAPEAQIEEAKSFAKAIRDGALGDEKPKQAAARVILDKFVTEPTKEAPMKAKKPQVQVEVTHSFANYYERCLAVYMGMKKKPVKLDGRKLSAFLSAIQRQAETA